MLIANSRGDKFCRENLGSGSAIGLQTLHAFCTFSGFASYSRSAGRCAKNGPIGGNPTAFAPPSGSAATRHARFPATRRPAAGQLLSWLSLLLICQAMWGGRAWGGLSATDVVVVVNAGSLNSRTLANHFVALRKIPAINVVVLEGVPNSEVIPVDDFREKILRPLLAELDRRKIRGHVQCVTYSADFPSAIDISGDLKDIKGLHQLFTPVGSINSLTYLYAQVLAVDPGYISLQSNFYARREFAVYFTNPGGTATQPTWKAIQEKITEGKHAAAADDLERLLKEHPHQFPCAYLAASQAALAGEKSRALRLLGEAVSKGWNASRYLKNDSRFDSLRQEPDYQVIELLLDENIKELQPAIGFDSRQAWTPNGVAVAQPQFGLRYLLSTVLGVTRGAGTNLPEAVDALRRSAAADFTHPAGTFYFALTDDVRTTTRQWGFIAAVDDLHHMGFQAEVIKEILPVSKKQILGLQFGTPSFDWNSTGSEFVPGAIADNLTSLGGVMTVGAGQTNLSELIKAGAAGSSGAVTEPYALQEKFPHPNMYVSYARGASLAEAFYLSVTGPYQLLIVGDPLCQPFAHAPLPQFNRQLRTLEVDQPLRLDFEQKGLSYGDWIEASQPWAQRNEPLAAVKVRLLLDGHTPRELAMQPTVTVALKGIGHGYHEIGVQFVAEGPLALRSEGSVPVWIGPPAAVELTLNGTELSSEFDQQVSLRKGTVAITVNSLAGQRVSVWHDAEQLAVASGQSHQFALPIDALGMGPIRLQAKAELADGSMIASRPVWLNVLP